MAKATHMDASPARRPLKRTFLTSAWLRLGLLLALLFGLGVLQLHITYTRITEEESSRLQTQAKVVAENLARQLGGVNNALASVRYDLVGGDVSGEPPVTPLTLKSLADAMSGVRGIIVLDAQGTITHAQDASLRGKNFKHRGYFAIPQKDPDYSRLYVSPPFKSMFGVYSVNLSKAIRGEDGQFAGVVSANLDPGYFEMLAKSVLYAPDMVVNVVHGTGSLFVDALRDASLVGRDLNAPDSMFSRHKASGNLVSMFKGVSASTGDERLMVVHTLAPEELRMDYPLVLEVSRQVSAIYAPWRSDLAMYMALFLLIVVSSVSALLFKQQRAQAAHREAETRRRLEQENARRFEFGLKSAALGLWDWDMEANVLTVNPRELEMLGYAEGEIEVTAENWRRRIHPEDLQAAHAGFFEHVKTSAEPYRLVHRMLHKSGQVLWVLSHTMVMERRADGRVLRVLGTHMDITQRMQTEATLRDSEQRLELAMKTGKMGFIDWRVAQNEVLFNERGYEILGRPTEGEELSLAAWKALRHPDDAARADVLLNALLAGEVATADIEYRVRHKAGHYIWLHLRAEVIERGPQKEPVRVMATFRNIQARKAAEFELKRVNEELARLTVTDGLTAVGNRRLFDQTLQEEWLRCARQGLNLGLLMVDIDHFKKYNDTYGHQGGDAVLAAVAEILKKCVQRSGELVARYGGEEFALLLPGSDMAASVAVARQCLAALQEATIPHKASPVSPWVSLSVGVASVVPDASQPASALLKAADSALYDAKRLGRNRYAPSQEDLA